MDVIQTQRLTLQTCFPTLIQISLSSDSKLVTLSYWLIILFKDVGLVRFTVLGQFEQTLRLPQLGMINY